MAQSPGSAPAPDRSTALAGAALTLTLALPALLLFVWSRPVPIDPELPPLRTPPSAVAEQLAVDARDAEAAEDDELARTRASRYHEANEAELAALDSPAIAQARATRLRAALDALIEAHGEHAGHRARALDLAEAEEVLRTGSDDPRRAPRLGGFLRNAQRYGLMRGSRQTAPRFVMRTVFKARWNTLHSRPLTDGLGEAEQMAYWGWLALRATEAPIALRLEGLERYEAAGGAHAEEARAALLVADHREREAREALEPAIAQRPSFRLRNVRLGLDVGSGDDDPAVVR